jgi:hypothetical protein
MEFDMTDMEVEPELYYEVDEEMINVKDKMWGLDRIRSTDGHTFRVERDVNEKCIKILFDDEIINHKTDKPVSKAVKRAQQRSLMEEELIEFKMSQCTQHTVPKSTEESSTRTVSATQTPEAPAKTKDHSNNHNCGEDEDHSAKAAPTATDSVKVTDKPSERDSNKDSVDNDDETTNQPTNQSKLSLMVRVRVPSTGLLQLQLHQRTRQSP